MTKFTCATLFIVLFKINHILMQILKHLNL